MRIFHDRLIDENDKAVVLDLLRGVITSKFSSAAEHVMADPILFGNFAHVPAMLEDDSVQQVSRFDHTYASMSTKYAQIFASSNN